MDRYHNDFIGIDTRSSKSKAEFGDTNFGPMEGHSHNQLLDPYNFYRNFFITQITFF